MVVRLSPSRRPREAGLSGLVRALLRMSFLVRVVVLASLLVTAASSTAAAGEALLPDPTRPPDSMSGATRATPGELPAFTEPQLQSVLIGAGRRSVIIGGQRYKIGDRVGDARLVKISENEVVLAGAGGRRTMTLFPPVKKRVDATNTAVVQRNTGRNAAPATEPKSEPGKGLNAGLNSSRSP